MHPLSSRFFTLNLCVCNLFRNIPIYGETEIMLPARPRGDIRILNKPGLARLLRERVADTTQTKAAEQARISQSVLNKILNQKKERLTPRTLGRLVHYLGRNNVARLKKTVLTGEATRALAEYRSWLVAELRAINEHQKGYAEDPFSDLTTLTKWMKSEVYTREGDQAHVALVELLRDLSDHPTYGKILDEFFEWVRRRGWEGGVWGARGKLAILRILGPLQATESSGGIERGLGEFRAGELTEYLKVAIRKEQILMTRAPDFERAQQVASDRLRRPNRFKSLS